MALSLPEKRGVTKIVCAQMKFRYPLEIEKQLFKKLKELFLKKRNTLQNYNSQCQVA